MVCLYHGDYGPADPTFDLGSASHFGMRGWVVDATLLKNARNIGEAEAIQRHLIRGESVSWCDQGYAWAEQDAVSWFYLAALLFVVLPYLIFRIKARAKIALGSPTTTIDGRQRLTD
jgi:4-amino-4-deoxy-L-arabinose transferase-like glycosyltransferase